MRPPQSLIYKLWSLCITNFAGFGIMCGSGSSNSTLCKNVCTALCSIKSRSEWPWLGSQWHGASIEGMTLCRCPKIQEDETSPSQRSGGMCRLGGHDPSLPWRQSPLHDESIELCALSTHYTDQSFSDFFILWTTFNWRVCLMDHFPLVCNQTTSLGKRLYNWDNIELVLFRLTPYILFLELLQWNLY